MKLERICEIQKGTSDPEPTSAPNNLGPPRKWELRVQDFRILFTETADTITVHNIGPRGGIYD
jgi:mRNA-degrading endonuclease RelE of RelBE toxin-antitoxin system